MLRAAGCDTNSECVTATLVSAQPLFTGIGRPGLHPKFPRGCGGPCCCLAARQTDPAFLLMACMMYFHAMQMSWTVWMLPGSRPKATRLSRARGSAAAAATAGVRLSGLLC